MNWRELNMVQRMSGAYTGDRMQWFAAGCDIFMPAIDALHEPRRLGYTRDPVVAEYICRVHNIFLELANEAVVLRTEVADLRKVLRMGK